MSASTVLAARRQSTVRWASALVGGPGELLDFIIPLWAGAALGLDSFLIGALVASELVVSFAARYPAGILADRWERRYIAGIGAALYALSCVGYAFSEGPALAFLSAVLGGIGGALFWVAARAVVSESITNDSGAYATLLSWQETGSWIAFVAGMTLLGSIDYRGVFLAAAAACATAAVALALTAGLPSTPSAGAPPSASSSSAPSSAPLYPDRLRPMVLATAVTSLAEAAVGLLLLLHLQQAFDLDVISIALVFLPGAIAVAVLPGPAHRLVLRIGRRRVAATAALASASFAAALAFAPSPLWIAVLWVLSGAAWAAIIPIEQAVIAETAGVHAGRGFGMYESASLAGAAAGTLLAGFAYGSASWTAACLIFAAVIAAGAVITPWAIRRSGVDDRPSAGAPLLPHAVRLPAPAAPVSLEAPATAPEPAPAQAPARAPADPVSDSPVPAEEPAVSPHDARSRWSDLGWHTALFAAAQLVLVLIGLSWLADLAASGDMGSFLASGGSSGTEGLGNFFYHAGKIWVIVFLVDVVWTVVTGTRPRESDRGR